MTFQYCGKELSHFSEAVIWKQYWAHQIRPFLGTRIADVGAGIGANAGLLGRPRQNWTCVEPDASLAARISANVAAGSFAFPCQVLVGSCRDLPPNSFDSILYIDVLEHIAEDRDEVTLAAEKLLPGGYLIALSPAHQFLYSAFDAAIGHCRRYTLATLVGLAPKTLKPVRVRYLDAVGMLASLANRFLLKKAQPGSSEIRVWDRCMVPCSRLIDPVFGYRLGKSLLCIWRRE